MTQALERIAYREEGPADSPVALLLHGYPESSYMWRGVMPAVAQAGWRALAPDLPGFGDSPAEAAVDEYWKCFADPDRRRGQLELYRSGDFEKLAPYEGRLAALGVPAKVIWGEDDPFAPVAGAHRLHAELTGSELVVIDGAGHFVVEDAPERYGAELGAFLRAVA